MGSGDQTQAIQLAYLELLPIEPSSHPAGYLTRALTSVISASVCPFSGSIRKKAMAPRAASGSGRGDWGGMTALQYGDAEKSPGHTAEP